MKRFSFIFALSFLSSFSLKGSDADNIDAVIVSRGRNAEDYRKVVPDFELTEHEKSFFENLDKLIKGEAIQSCFTCVSLFRRLNLKERGLVKIVFFQAYSIDLEGESPGVFFEQARAKFNSQYPETKMGHKDYAKMLVELNRSTIISPDISIHSLNKNIFEQFSLSLL